MSHREFSMYDRDPKASTDESAPPPVQMASMSKPKFGTDSGGSPWDSLGSAFRRYKGGVPGGVSQWGNEWKAQIEVPEDKMGRSINGFSVEIRPPRWSKTISMGQFKTLERAQYVADAVYHYLGMPPFHFLEAVRTLPAITCIGSVIGTPVELSTQEMCASYVHEIAEGENFEPQREDFIQKVRNVVKHPDFPFLTGPDRDSKAPTDESVPPPAQMASLMSKPKFGTDSGGSPAGLSGKSSWRYTGSVWHSGREAQIEVPDGKMGNSINVFNVGIRPLRWSQKIWMGQFKTLERAQYVADAVYHYLGMPPFHFPEAVMTLPAITCIGSVIGTPVELSTQEMCASYVHEIAEGENFEPQREDFIRKVKNVVKHPDFPFLTGPDRDSKAPTDESVPPPVQFSERKFRSDSGGNLVGSSRTASWRYKGVSFVHGASKWVAETRVSKGNKGNKGNKIWLGPYPTQLEAAFAYDLAVTCLGGSESMLNFHHPIYKQVPRILLDLSQPDFVTECKKVVREFSMLAKESGNSVPMTLVDKPKYNTDSGGSWGGLLETSQECPDLCPECGKIFLMSKSMLLHLMDHWRNQQSSPPPQSSHDSGRDSWSPGIGSRWRLMYKGVRYWQVPDSEVDAPGAMATHDIEKLPSQVDDWEVHDKWDTWIWLPHGNEILLGSYSTPLEAAYAYDVAIMCLGGESLLNFHGHEIYKEIPQISQNLSLQAVAMELVNKVKDFGKLAVEGGYYGMPEQYTTFLDFDKTTSYLNSLQIFDTPEADDHDIFQKNKRLRLSDISCSHGKLWPQQSYDLLIDKTMEDIPLPILESKEDMQGMLPLHFLGNWQANSRNKQPYQPVSLGHDVLSRSPDGALKFTMADLKNITTNFSESLTVGQGSFASVYRGQLKDGTNVVVKRIMKNDKNVLEIEAAKDFQIEADTLSKKQHLNLVRLLGFLEDENELILVTEYVTNGNLRQHLDGVPYGVTLDMSKRCRISLDVVAALKHLHNQIQDDLNIIHRNIKSSDILITNDFRAMVAGFDLSQRSPIGDGASSSSTLVKGTLGHMTHEHSTTHHLKEKNDVYSFGRLLVEIFTGQRLQESSLLSDECFTLKRVLKLCTEGRLVDIIDTRITPTTFNLKIIEQIFKLADSCLVLEESIRPTVEDIFRDLSFIMGGGDEDEINCKGVKWEVQEEKKWDPKACIEPNFQTLCLEESKALKRQEPTKHLDKGYSSNPSFMPTKPHGSFFVEDLESNKAQTRTQLGTQLEVDSKQATRQVASEVLVAKQDQSSPLFTNIISDVIPLKSDETYFEKLQEEIAKLDHISSLLSEGDDFEQNLTNIGKTSFFLYFNEKDNVFEFYFKNYQGMASIVGVGLECAKVVLEDGWRVTIQEISKPNWDDAWKNFDSSSSTMKVTIPEPLEEGMDSMEDSPNLVASIPRGQCLLLDLAQYFILKKAIASFLPSASMMHANTDSGTSSSSSNQDIARSSFSSEQKPSAFLQAMKSIFISREANQLKTKNVDGTPMASPSDDDVKTDTTVHLKLLPGGCLYEGSNLLDASISDDKELEELTSQLDNSICLEMMFKFLNKDDKKEIHAIVGPISFQFQEENENNYEKTGRYGWYHKLLEVSFGSVNAHSSEIGPNHKALDIVDWKMSKMIGSSNATTHGSLKSMNGGVKGSIPNILTLSSEGSLGWSNSTCESVNVGDNLEKPFQMTIGGFDIFPKRYQLSSTLKYAYRAPDYSFEIDPEKLPYEDYRKLYLNLLPMCSPQDIKFEGTWYPKDLEYNPQVLAEYSLTTSRLVHMTSKDIPEKVVKKSWIKRCGHLKMQKESNEPLKYTQKYTRSFFLNHAMTHLNGEKFKVEESLHQRPLNQRELETHLEDRSHYAPQWRANPLVGLNLELDNQP